MRWTVWHKRTSCQNCGAKISVPATGLTMVCQYCGTESPVPDIEERKQKQRQAQRSQRGDGEAHQPGGDDQRRAAGPPRRAATQSGAGRGLLGFLLTICVIVAVLHFTGVLSRFTEPLIGDDGSAHYDEAEAPLLRDGYVRMTQEKTERAFAATKLYLDLKPGHRVALVLGSGQPLARVIVRTPRGRQVLRRSTLRFHETLTFTPGIVGVYTATVQLERPGRYRWALLRGPKSSKSDRAQELLSRRRKQLQQRRAKARRRTTRRSRTRKRTTQKTTVQPDAIPARAVPPTPSSLLPPLPRAKDDDEIKRAIKAGEIEDVDNP